LKQMLARLAASAAIVALAACSGQSGPFAPSAPGSTGFGPDSSNVVRSCATPLPGDEVSCYALMRTDVVNSEAPTELFDAL